MLLCLTANHLNAAFDVLERLSADAQDTSLSLVERGEFVSGAVVLATCNRFEAYLDIDASTAAASGVALEGILEVLRDASGVHIDTLRSSVTVHVDDEVVHHLFSVTSGLESVVIGEDEISGQVRRALDSARESGTASSGLEQLFQSASHTSRGVKNRTAIGGAGRSLVRLALELASSRIADWAEARVLIVGTGQYAATTVTALRDRGASELRVYSPSGRAAPFALKYDLTAETDLRDAIADADVIITCTATTAIGSEPVTAAAIVPGNRVLVIDLGLPRNVDPAVAAIDGVELLDLETISLHAPLEELSAHDDARALIGDAAAEFTASSTVGPAIAAYRGHVFELLDAEIARARSRGAGDETEAALRHLAGVLLHEPSVRARELAKEGRAADFIDGLESVYGIRPAPTPAAGTRQDSATA